MTRAGMLRPRPRPAAEAAPAGDELEFLKSVSDEEPKTTGTAQQSGNGGAHRNERSAQDSGACGTNHSDGEQGGCRCREDTQVWRVRYAEPTDGVVLRAMRGGAGGGLKVMNMCELVKKS